MGEHRLEGDEPIGRLDRADLRADRSDRRQDRSDVRATDYEGKSKEDLAAIGDLLRNISTALENLDGRITDTKRDLGDERKRDRRDLHKLRIITAVALIAGLLASISAFSTCRTANENRSTLRIIVAAATAASMTPRSPEGDLRRAAFQKVVDDKTTPINCVNPVNYLSRST